MIEILEPVLRIGASIGFFIFGYRVAAGQKTADSQNGVTIHFFEGRVQTVTSSDPDATARLLKGLGRLLQRRGAQ